MRFRALVDGLFAVALAGCASLVGGGPLIRPDEPTGAIRFVNAS